MTSNRQSPSPEAEESKISGVGKFWDELKRRKVVRVAITYAVVGWLIIQIAVSTFPKLGIPGWAESLVIMLVILGFPVALVIAWAFEVTPEGIKPDSKVRTRSDFSDTKGHKLNYITLGLVVLVLTFLVVDRHVFNGSRNDGSSRIDSTTNDLPVVVGTVNLPKTAELASVTATVGFNSQLITLSPDSEWLVYVGRHGPDMQLFRKKLKSLEDPKPITGTEGAISAFFAPDGKSVGFLTDSHVKYSSIEGNDIQSIATTSSPVRGFWKEDDWVYFVESEGAVLRRVLTEGGEVEVVFDSLGENNLWLNFSDVLPGGRLALASEKPQSVSGDYDKILLIDLRSGAIKPLGITGYNARWIPSGHLVFGRSGNLMAVRFNLEERYVVGDPVSLIMNVAMDSFFNVIQIAISHNGTLAFIPGPDQAFGEIVAVERQGPEKQFPTIPPQKYGALDLSKDDKLLAIHRADVRDYVWIYDLDRQEGRKLVGSDGYGWPKWDRSGKYLALGTQWNREVESNLVTISVDGLSTHIVRNPPEGEMMELSDWSPDGDELLVSSPNNIGSILRKGEHAVRWMGKAPSLINRHPVFSPDGKWVAYTSNESGSTEVWVRSYSDGEVRRQVSVNGGLEPVWRNSGEIFFRRKNEVWSSTVTLEPELILGPEKHAFTISNFLDTNGLSYDVSSDGQTLYAVKRAEPAIDDQIHVVTNWSEELERLVPTEQ